MWTSQLKIATAFLLLASVPGTRGALALAGRNVEVQQVLDKYRSFRPGEKDLAIFQLDWASTLKDARERAAGEQRPILLIVVTNSYGNVYTGHC